MRAVVICHHSGFFPEALLSRRPFCLFPAGVRPMAQIVLEWLISQGVRRVTFAVSDNADYVQGHFGNGERWGAAVDYALLKRFEGIGETLRRLPGERGEDVLVVPGMLMTAMDIGVLTAARAAGGRVCVAVLDAAGPALGEIALLSPEAAASMPPGLSRLGGYASDHAGQGGAVVVHCPDEALFADDFESFWRAHHEALGCRGLFAACVDKPGRVGLRCSVDATAVVTPPVIVGNDVSIGPGCRVGPDAVIGDGCILDSGVEAADCLALPGTYFGPDISLVSAVADRELLVRYPDGAATHVPDFFIMGPVNAMTTWRASSRILQRVLAVVMLALGLPLLLALRIAGFVMPGKWRRQTFAGSAHLEALSGEIGLGEVSVCLFDSINPFFRNLPALWDVVRGEVNLVGVELIGPEKAAELIGTWAEPRLFCRPGLIHPWTGLAGMLYPDDMEKRVMEIYYANTRSLSSDFKILWSAAKGWTRILLRIAD